MALRNPSGLYTGGVVDLNPNVYMNIALQAQAKRQAKEEAIDRYYRDLPSKINDKGVRDQDRPYIEELRNDIYNYGISNRQALAKGSGAAQLEMEKKFRKAAEVIAQSQALSKKSLERGKMYLSKDNRWVLDDDAFMAAEDLESRPINDPEHREMDMALLLQNRPFNQQSYQSKVKGLFPYSEEISQRKANPNNPIEEIVTTVPKLSNDTKRNLYAYAADQFHSDKSFRKHIQENITPDLLSDLNEISQNVFGHPINSDEDIAAAYTITQIPNKPYKEKFQNDVKAKMDYAQAQKKEMESVRNRNIINRAALRQRLGLQPNTDNEGIAFDETGQNQDVKFTVLTKKFGIPFAYPGGRISKGVVLDSDGNVQKDGEIIISKEDLPVNVITALGKEKITLPKNVTVIVKDGAIDAIKTPNNGVVNRQGMSNLQKSFDKEPQKSEHLKFGSKKQQSPAKKTKQDPLGIL